MLKRVLALAGREAPEEIHGQSSTLLIFDNFFCSWQPVAEHTDRKSTSELQSLMRISYAVFCLKKKKKQTTNTLTRYTHNNKLIYILQHYNINTHKSSYSLKYYYHILHTHTIQYI